MQTMTSTRNRSATVSPDDAAPAITARGLTRTYGEVTAVDALDLTIHEGEIYGLLGPNGAGKSTTIKMLCTLLSPSGGQAQVAGLDIVEQPKDVRLHIGVALQDVALDPKQTGLELLRLQGQLYGLRRDEIEQRLAELRTLVDLGDALDRRIGTYSGGMRRRLDLAAAAAALEGVYGVLKVEGRDHELTISVDDGSAAIGPIAIALHTASVRVRDLTLRTPTLDDVFLELTGAHFDIDGSSHATHEEARS
jgi:ABC-type transport system involved in cytochrome c biogenesis ATPase subunit